LALESRKPIAGVIDDALEVLRAAGYSSDDIEALPQGAII